MATHLQILDHGHEREDAPTLGTMGDAQLQNATGGGARDVLPLEDEPAAGRRHKTRDRLERRGLAGTVGPDQRDEFALVNFERKLADRGDLTIAAGQALNLQYER